MSNNKYALEVKPLFTFLRSKVRGHFSTASGAEVTNIRRCQRALSLSYLQLLLLEHVRFWGIEDVVSKLSLAIYVDRCCSFTGQEAVVDLPGSLRELKKDEG